MDHNIAEDHSEILKKMSFDENFDEWNECIKNKLHLDDRIDKIESILNEKISENYVDLLEHCNIVENVEEYLIDVHEKMQKIGNNLIQLKQKIDDNFSQLEQYTNTLSNLYKTNQLLNAVMNFRQLMKCFRDSDDSVKQSLIIHELETEINESHLEKVTILNDEIQSIKTRKSDIFRIAKGNLLKTLSKPNVSEIKEALQIFYNLNNLDEVVEKITHSFITECSESLKFALQMEKTESNKASVESFRNKFWTNLERTFKEDITRNFKQLDYLNRSLLKLNNTSSELYKNFYSNTLLKIIQEISSCLKKIPNSTKHLIETEYLKLLQFYIDLFKIITFDIPKHEYMKILTDVFESNYLSKLMKKFQNSVHTIIKKDNIPTDEQINSIVFLILGELLASNISNDLFQKVEKNVSKLVHIFRMKIEEKTFSDSDIGQIIEHIPNQNQNINMQLANCLYYFKNIFMETAKTYSLNLSENLYESVKELDELYLSILHPLTVSINQTVEKIIVTIYYEKDWEILDVQNINTCSPYMKELSQFLCRVYKSYLAGYKNKELLDKKCKEISHRTLELFIRHSILLKPVSKGGRFRLQYDYGFLEKSLKQIYGNLSNLGPIYQLFKSMELLIISNPEDIAKSEIVTQEPSTILLLLFSYGCPELSISNQKRKLSNEKFSQWLDKHTEQEKLEIISSTLKDYEESSKCVDNDPIYLLMKEILNSSYKENNL